MSFFILCNSHVLILFLWAADSHFTVISLILGRINVDTSPSDCVGFLSSQNLPIRVRKDILNTFCFPFMPLSLYRFTMWICIHKSENRNLKRIPQLPDQKSCIKIWYASSLKKEKKSRWFYINWNNIWLHMCLYLPFKSKQTKCWQEHFSSSCFVGKVLCSYFGFVQGEGQAGSSWAGVLDYGHCRSIRHSSVQGVHLQGLGVHT